MAGCTSHNLSRHSIAETGSQCSNCTNERAPGRIGWPSGVQYVWDCLRRITCLEQQKYGWQSSMCQVCLYKTLYIYIFLPWFGLEIWSWSMLIEYIFMKICVESTCMHINKWDMVSNNVSPNDMFWTHFKQSVFTLVFWVYLMFGQTRNKSIGYLPWYLPIGFWSLILPWANSLLTARDLAAKFILQRNHFFGIPTSPNCTDLTLVLQP